MRSHLFQDTVVQVDVVLVNGSLIVVARRQEPSMHAASGNELLAFSDGGHINIANSLCLLVNLRPSFPPDTTIDWLSVMSLYCILMQSTTINCRLASTNAIRTVVNVPL